MKSLDIVGKQTVAPSQRRKNIPKGKEYSFYCQSSKKMQQVADGSVALTVTSPPYWNAIDYDLHAESGMQVDHRQREYTEFGATYKEWLKNVSKIFKEVYRATAEGGYCCIVVGTILYKGKHYPAPYDLTTALMKLGWEFHQDIIWNKVTGGVKRAGVFIRHNKAGYYYPNIMTEYVIVFRKPGEKRRGAETALPIDEVFKKDIANNIWHIAPVPPKHINHPCPYPEELVRRLILLYSQKSDLVLDPFLGSGQTAKVALHHKRKVVGYDIEQKYIDLSIERLGEPASKRKYQLLPQMKKILAL